MGRNAPAVPHLLQCHCAISAFFILFALSAVDTLQKLNFWHALIQSQTTGYLVVEHPAGSIMVQPPQSSRSNLMMHTSVWWNLNKHQQQIS